MDAKLIEKLDRRRYKYLLWQTVGFALVFPEVLVDKFPFEPRILNIIFVFVVGIGAGLFLAATFKSSRNERCIKSDPALRDAVNNELVVLYGYKSLKQAAIATLTTAVALFLLSDWWPGIITARLACLLVIYIGILTLKISQLVYLRR
jgi:hypothetical protein